MKVEECIRSVASRLAGSDSFYGHGTETPEDEAAWLVMHATGPSGQHDEVNATSLEVLESLLDRRIRLKVPTAYLLGHSWFCGLKIMLNQDVLIPRSPIAELIEQGFTPWLNPQAPLRVLDLCTGSGCIAVAMAHSWPAWRVDAIDISASAVNLAKRNCIEHDLSARLQVFQGDLFAPCGNALYDLVVANPPYVSTSEYAILPSEYKAEPALALLAGDDGLDIVYRILNQAVNHLTEKGLLICEVGHSQATLVAQMPAAPFMWFEFEHGGEGVFMLDREQLVDLADEVKQIMSER